MEEQKFPQKQFIDELINVKKPIEEVKATLSNPANANLLTDPIDKNGRYLIESAARVGNLPLVEHLLNLDPNRIKYHKPSNGADLLQHAVVSGNIDLVKMLISRGSDFKYRYFMDTSILYYALKYKRIDVFKCFVEEYKMMPNDVLSSNGIQPIYMAMEQKNRELFNYLLSFNPELKNHGQYNLLAYAAKLDDTYFLDELTKRNTPFEKIEMFDRSAFSYSGEENKLEQMEHILKGSKGVKPEPLLAPGISRASHEYNNICYKWTRVYDIYMTRYYCELRRNETAPKANNKSLMEDKALAKIYEKIYSNNSAYGLPSLMFKVPRNIFKCVMKYLEVCPFVDEAANNQD